MPEWHSGNVIANGIEIHYHRTGGDKPPIVLSHGITDSGLCWTHVAQALEPDYDVVMYDARGHGLSAAPESGHASEERAADLAELIQALGLGKPCLLGHSMGAATTAAAAAAYPDLVRCAILEDPPWRQPSPETTAEGAAARAAQWRDRTLGHEGMMREQLIARVRQDNPTWPEAELGPWADAKPRVSTHIFQGMALPRTPWQEVVQKIRCPILLITADPDKGAIVTPEIAQEAAGLWQEGEVAHITGAGHNIRREQYRAYVEVVRAFLGRVVGR
jgi:N-formylmaleamate deformylase